MGSGTSIIGDRLHMEGTRNKMRAGRGKSGVDTEAGTTTTKKRKQHGTEAGRWGDQKTATGWIMPCQRSASKDRAATRVETRQSYKHTRAKAKTATWLLGRRRHGRVVSTTKKAHCRIDKRTR